jgi:hypothetical protein
MAFTLSEYVRQGPDDPNAAGPTTFFVFAVV